MGESVSFTVFLKDHATKPLVDLGKTGQNVFGGMDRQMDKENTSASKLGGVFSGLSGLAGGVFAGISAFATLTSIGGLAVEAEKTNIAFETMLGSAEKGRKAIKERKDFSAATPFESDCIAKGFFGGYSF